MGFNGPLKSLAQARQPWLLRNLFLAVFLNVGFRGLVGMVSHVNPVPPRRMRVVPSFFVITSLVMLCCFVMMVSGERTMFRRLSVVLGCFFDICFLHLVGQTPVKDILAPVLSLAPLGKVTLRH